MPRITMGTAEQSYIERVVRWLVIAAAVAATVWLLRYLADVLLPFAAAVVLAYLLNPVVEAVERRTGRRGLAVGVTLGGLGLAGIGVVVLLVPLTIAQVGQFRETVEKLRQDLSASVEYVTPPEESGTATSAEAEAGKRAGTELGWDELKEGWTRFREDSGAVPRSVRLARLRESVDGTYIGAGVERLIRYSRSEEFSELLVSLAKRLAIGGWSVVTFTVNAILGLTGLLVVLLYLVFLLVDFPVYARTWPAFLPPAYRESIVEFLDQFRIVMQRYFRGQALVALFVGTLSAVGFTLIGLPMAVPFGLLVGLLNMIPYLQIVALVPGVLLAALRAIEGGSSFIMSIVLVLVVFAVVQVVQDGLIVPRLMGKATGLRPVAILLGVFIWGKLLGFLGLVLAIPLTCLGIAYYRRVVLQHSPESTRLTDSPLSS